MDELKIFLHFSFGLFLKIISSQFSLFFYCLNLFLMDELKIFVHFSLGHF